MGICGGYGGGDLRRASDCRSTVSRARLGTGQAIEPGHIRARRGDAARRRSALIIEQARPFQRVPTSRTSSSGGPCQCFLSGGVPWALMPGALLSGGELMISPAVNG